MTAKPWRPPHFTSRLAPIIEAYLQLKAALGRRYSAERTILRSLDAFLTTIDDDLTSDTFAAWNATLERLRPGVRRNWLRVVRNLCLYRRRTIADMFVPDPTGFPKPHTAIRPYIFTTADIARLLKAADRLDATPLSPLRHETFRLAIVLLYTSGLRRGELVRLTVGDYDASDQTLLVRESKFHKSRLLPVSRDAQRELTAYLLARRQRGFPLAADSALIWNRSRRGGRPYTGEALRCGVDALFDAAHIRTSTGTRPRVHDLRHTFAVHALLRWYHRGVDPQAKLPFLSTYMGHVSPVSTAYYLPFVSALAEAASLRFLRTCGSLVTAPPAGDRP
jgi:integrase/recombinase XerD